MNASQQCHVTECSAVIISQLHIEVVNAFLRNNKKTFVLVNKTYTRYRIPD